MTDEQTQSFIDKLEEALADNVLSVEFDGKKTTFDSAQAIIRRIKYFKNKLNKSGAPNRLSVVTLSEKGL